MPSRGKKIGAGPQNVTERGEGKARLLCPGEKSIKTKSERRVKKKREGKIIEKERNRHPFPKGIHSRKKGPDYEFSDRQEKENKSQDGEKKGASIGRGWQEIKEGTRTTFGEHLPAGEKGEDLWGRRRLPRSGAAKKESGKNINA